MASRNRFIIGLFGVVVAILLMLLFAPALVSRGVRVWIWWKNRGSSVTVQFDSVEAPFLRPIVLRGFRMQTSPAAEVRIEATATRVVFALNLKGILLRTRGRTLRSLSVENLRAEVHRNRTGKAFSEDGWNTVHRLLPESFEIQSFDVRVEDAPTVLLLRGASLTGTPIEAGHLQGGEMVISSPMIRQTFTDLRGATDWQGDRLTIAGLTLSRGLDMQSITLDLSHLGKRRVGVEFDVDAFGGKLRGSLTDEWRSHRSNWNVAGSANDISVAQTAEAFGFTDRVDGLIHAGKFTFRGDPAEALPGTASLWMELTAPAWRDRAADVIMLGLSLYGRQIELQQLYIKQKKNQLTLNGQGSFPTSAAGWLRPDFSGNVSASIDDLGEFASLFGGDRNAFAGQIQVEGTLNARDRNVGGNLLASGSGLTMFKSSIDEFHAELRLKRDETEIAQLELKRKNDVLRAQGKVDNSPEHNYSGTIDTTIHNLDDYLPLLYGSLETKPTYATMHADITSSVWEAQAVLDPAQSKPVSLAGTFALRIGQPLDAIWNSPVTVTVDAPALYLAEIPRRQSSAPFGTGIVSAQLTITQTLRHPRVTGYAQLVDGHVGPTELDSRIRFDGNHGVVESLRLGDKQNGATFFGDVDLQDTQQLKMRLFPNQSVYDLNSATLDCATRIDVVPVDPSLPGTPISEIELRRWIAPAGWTVSLTKSPFEGLPFFIGIDFRPKTFRFCSTNNSAETPLTIGVQTSPTPTPTPTPRPRKRKR